MGLTLRPFGQLLGALPGEDAGLDPAKAQEPPVRGNYPVEEEALKLSDGLQFGPQFLTSSLRAS